MVDVDNLKNIQSVDKNLSGSFAGIIDEKYGYKMRKKCLKSSRVIWKLKWNKTKYAGINCNNTREDVDKLYKCKQCRVSRYCSKHCHQYFCKNLR